MKIVKDEPKLKVDHIKWIMSTKYMQSEMNEDPMRALTLSMMICELIEKEEYLELLEKEDYKAITDLTYLIDMDMISKIDKVNPGSIPPKGRRYMMYVAQMALCMKFIIENRQEIIEHLKN